MGLRTQAPSIIIALAAALFTLAACTHGLPFAGDRQIRERIGSVREAILAKRAEGVVQYATPDWTFRGPDGKSYDRGGYLERTRKQFSTAEVETLQTDIGSIDINGDRAAVRIHQAMVRTETDSAGGLARWRVTYDESQDWQKTSRGWLVARVQVHPLSREKLSPD
jgi:ketosteroid isomerase-like protein